MAAPLGAQGGDPTASIEPADLTVTSPSITVTVTFRADTTMSTATRRIWLDTVNVTGQFTHTPEGPGSGLGGRRQRTSSGTITLRPGVNTVSAQVCDVTGNCSAVSSRTYTYLAGRPEVRVSPDGGVASASASTPKAHTFQVVNAGTAAGTYALRPECRDAWTGLPHAGCTASAATVTVAAGDSATVTVTAPGVAAGTTQVVRLVAEVTSMAGVMDAGWMDVTVAGSAGTTMPLLEVEMADLATGAYPILRSQCVTASAGPGAAYECGDLRLAHALPAHRTFNRTWAPVLMYNSRHADPRPTAYFDVTLPAGSEVPWRVVPVLYFPGSGNVVQPPFHGGEWQPGTTRRIAVPIDTAGLGWHNGYYAQVLAQTHDGRQSSTPVLAPSLTVVNREASPFGAGWWLAGLEHLVCFRCGPDAAHMLWVGGDGSTRYYAPLPGGTTWESTNAGSAPDTLTLIGYTYYVRKLPDGGRVEFNGEGRHVRTVNRLGQVTTFEWQNGRLTRIVLPTGGGTAPAYDFVYDAGGVLTSVNATAPGAPTRTVTLGHELGDRRVTYLQDPDGQRVLLAYGGARPNVVTRRTDRRGTPLTFTWSATGRLTSTRLGVTGADSIISRFEPVEDKGFGQSVAVAQAYTVLDGPRTDVADRTLVWADRRGAARRIRDPLGGETVLTRGEAAYPALVTEVRTTSARGDSLVLRSKAGYDHRGRVDTTFVFDPLGPGTGTITTYGWNDTVDRPAWIKAPGAEPVYIGYDPLTRNPIWQQQGASQARRVLFQYNAAGQVTRIRYPHATNGTPGGGGEDVMEYDAVGNLKRTVSPLGSVTLIYRDPLGRVTETISPVHAGSSSDSAAVANTGLRQTVAYDAMDRDTLSVTYGPPMTLNRGSQIALVNSTPAEVLTVRTEYDAGGLPLKVQRWSTPDPADIGVLTMSYVYDEAGRKTLEGDDVDGDDAYTYDPAGNLVQHVTQRNHAIGMTYDALGRLTRRVTPGVIYGPTDVNCADPVVPRAPDAPRWDPCNFHFPTFPNSASGGWTIPGDTAYYAFDAAGGMVRAQNADAVVSRTYFAGGALRTDSLRIRAYGSGDFSKHVYGLEYRYDEAGRVRALLHPSNLAGTAQRDSFAYEPVAGALQTVVGRTNLAFGYGYDLLGRLTSETIPGTSGNAYTYDLEGRRTGRAGVYGETFTYDARGKVLSVAIPGRSVFRNYYSGIGNLVATEWDNDNNAAMEVEEFRVDALGHQVWRRSANAENNGHNPEYATLYTQGTSRVYEVQFVFPEVVLDSTRFARDTTFRTYDMAGNVQDGWERAWGTSYRKVHTRSYYGADNKLRAQQGYHELGGMFFTGERRGYFSEYRYDALGRRVLVRTRRDGLCNTNQTSTVDCTSGIERFVWAGDNILWEMRGPGANSETADRLEQVSAVGVEYGIVGYTHAGGVDRPLVAYKTAGGNSPAVVVPHMNWRGLFSRGTTASGAETPIAVEWPGFRTTAWHYAGETQGSTKNWMGSLLEEQRDAGGLLYKRNRYYDPKTGQFTQSDPIGLGGGLNTYGFADGDPVSYDDPYGLCAWGIGPDAAHGRCNGMEPEDDVQQQPGGPRRPGRVSIAGFRRGRSALPGGSLAANEGPGRGHTIAYHVVDRAFIRNRAQDPRGVGEASRFYNLSMAENAIGAVIANNQLRINVWLAPGNYSPTLRMRMRMPFDVGEIAYRDGSIRAGRSVYVLLVRDRLNLTYYVHTGYVER
jgi:RHS repeat-associated protein